MAKLTLTERISARLDKELQKQKESGKKFISDEEVDLLIDRVIKEELTEVRKDNSDKKLSCIHDLTRLRLIGSNITCLDCRSTWVKVNEDNRQPSLLPCGEVGCQNPHERTYRGCGICKFKLPD